MKTKETRRWMSSYDECDICHKPIKSVVPWFVDGKTTLPGGCWALLCPECYEKYGVGLGTGKGQKYNGSDGILLDGGSAIPSNIEDIEGYEP